MPKKKSEPQTSELSKEKSELKLESQSRDDLELNKNDLFDFESEEMLPINLNDIENLINETPETTSVDTIPLEKKDSSVEVKEIANKVTLSTNKKNQKKLTKKLEIGTKANQKKKTAKKASPTKTLKKSVASNLNPTSNKFLAKLSDKRFKSLILYLDNLLSGLPEEKVKKFAHSPHFEVFVNLLKEIEE